MSDAAKDGDQTSPAASNAAPKGLKQGAAPAVIVSDYRLCDSENGIEVIHQLRRAAGQMTPACLMSGDTDPSLMAAAREVALTLLHKPVRPAKLRSLIRRLALDAQSAQSDGVSLL